MPEYTIKDVIIDPEDPRLEGAVGKPVYGMVIPVDCVLYANGAIGDGSTEILRKIISDSDHPFICKDANYPCVIIAKEDPKPEYVPFSSKEEFVEMYEKITEKEEFDSFNDKLFQCGMWLICKEQYSAVTIISDEGIVSRGIFTCWKDLCKNYTFLDGTPCGKLKEEDYE